MRRLYFLISAFIAFAVLLVRPILALDATITGVTAGCGGVTVSGTVTTIGIATFTIVVRNANTNAVLGMGFGGTASPGVSPFTSPPIFINPTLVNGTPIQVTVTLDLPETGTATSNVMPCTGGIIPPSPVTPGAPTEEQFVPAPIINDGRINPGKGDMHAVIYETADGGLEIYDVDDKGSGFLVISVPEVALAEYPEQPGENTLIASSADGKTTLYKLTSGEYQVNTEPDGEGKVISIIFTGRDNVYTHEYFVYG